jgi:hypothetical protein
MLLFTNAVDFLDSAARNDIVDRIASPDQMLHTMILSGSDRQPHQILYVGDRILDLGLIRLMLNISDLNVDCRFHDTDFELGYQRLSPMRDGQGCVTYIDKSLLGHEVVNVVTHSNPWGVWVNIGDILTMFAEVNFIHIFSGGCVDGMNMGDNEAFNSRLDQKVLLDSLYKDPGFSHKKIVFESSRNEILTLYSCGAENIEIEEIVELLETDCFLYSYVYEYFLSISKSNEVKMLNIVESIGKKEVLEFLHDVSMSSNTVDSRDVNLRIGRQLYVCQASASFLMRFVTRALSESRPGLDPDLAEHIGRLSMQPIVFWANFVDIESFEVYVNKCSVNPHRFLTEIQESVVGFNQHDALEYLAKTRGFPDLVKLSLVNSSSPFYVGDDSYYANLLYIVMSMLVERKIISNLLFEGIKNTESVLVKRMGIESEINLAFKELTKIEDSISRKEWRFFDNSLSRGPSLKIKSSHFVFVK